MNFVDSRCEHEEAEETLPQHSLLEAVYRNQLNHREIILNGLVDDSVVETVVMQIFNFNREDDIAEAEAKSLMGDDYLKVYDRSSYPITVFIHTDGGEVFDGLSVISAIKGSRTPVHTKALGKAISMGFMILISGDRRFCQHYSRVMYHQISYNSGCQTLRDIEEYAEHCGELQTDLESMVKEWTLIPQDVLDDVFVRKNDLYLTPEQALEWGVVDELF